MNLDFIKVLGLFFIFSWPIQVFAVVLPERTQQRVFKCSGKDALKENSINTRIKIEADNTDKVQSAVVVTTLGNETLVAQYSGGLEIPKPPCRDLCFARLNNKDNPSANSNIDGTFMHLYFKDRRSIFKLKDLSGGFSVILKKTYGSLTNKQNILFTLNCQEANPQ